MGSRERYRFKVNSVFLCATIHERKEERWFRAKKWDRMAIESGDREDEGGWKGGEGGEREGEIE